MSADSIPPAARESSNQQDAAPSRAETAVQDRPSRSIPKALVVEPVAASVIRSLIATEHYLQSMPPAARLCFGVRLDGELAGGIVFTNGSRNGHRLLAAAQPHEVATLARLWLRGDLPRNSESRVLGVALRHLKRHTGWKLVISYADPGAGHVGTVYQASGWRYLGQGEPTAYVRLPDGRLHHPRSVYDQFGTNRVGHLRATGIDAERVVVHGKHRYVFVLDPGWAWRLTTATQAFPRAGCRGPPASPPLPIGSRPARKSPSRRQSRRASRSRFLE